VIVASTPDLTPSDPWSVPPPTPVPPFAVPPPVVQPPAPSYGLDSHVPPSDPVPPPDVVAPGPVILQIGEIGVTSAVVHTPAGDIPLAGSTWQVSDYWHSEQKIPTWAIVAAIAGFCVLTVFSLLFLLVKVTIPRGTVQVTVTNGTRQYVARIPVTDQSQVSYVHQQVNYVRSLAAL
jgi:hypothetical protein